MSGGGENIREIFSRNGLKQGLIVPAADIGISQSGGTPLEEGMRVLVIGQTCDLINDSFDKEPYALCLILREPTKPNPQYTHGHNSRLLQVTSDAGVLYEAWAWEQVTAKREGLLKIDFKQYDCLNVETCRVVSSWLAKRFNRTAFPDSFVEAFRKGEQKLKKELKRKHQLFKEVLVSLSPFRELKKGEKYKVDCTLLMGAVDYEKSGREAGKFAITLSEIFENADFEVVSCEPVSEHDFYYADFIRCVRLDFDFLSFREEEDCNEQ